jgi:hypothetical protein
MATGKVCRVWSTEVLLSWSGCLFDILGFPIVFGSPATAGFLSILVDPDMDINYDVILGIYLVATVICGALYVGEKFLDVEAIEGFWLVVSRVKFACHHSGFSCVYFDRFRVIFGQFLPFLPASVWSVWMRMKWKSNLAEDQSTSKAKLE